MFNLWIFTSLFRLHTAPRKATGCNTRLPDRPPVVSSALAGASTDGQDITAPTEPARAWDTSAGAWHCSFLPPEKAPGLQKAASHLSFLSGYVSQQESWQRFKGKTQQAEPVQ